MPKRQEILNGVRNKNVEWEYFLKVIEKLKSVGCRIC
jgi:hypothetical protein